MIFRMLLLAGTLSGVMSTTSWAGLMISVESKSIVAGTTDTIDVWLSSNLPFGEAFLSTAFELNIAPVDSPSTSLEFGSLTSPASTYVLPGFSGVASVSLPETTLTNTVFKGSFFSFFPSNVAVPSESAIAPDPNSILLARLPIAHILPVGINPSTLVGQQFSIEVNQAFTKFEFFTPLAFSSTPGTITIAPESSLPDAIVPEPSSATILLMGGLLIGGGCMRRRREVAVE